MYVGKYSKKKRGGNSPNSVIDQKINEGKDTLFFPNDIGIHQFLMIFHEYDFKGEAEIMKESIVLPIPGQIIDKYGVEYNSKDLKTLGAGIASAAEDIIDSFKKAGTAEGEAKEAQRKTDMTAESLAGDLGTGGIALAREQFAGTLGVEDPLAVATGTLVNPHTALLFSSVNLKVFDFEWKLYPQNEDESNNLQEIIRVIKMRSHPTFDAIDGTQNNFIMKYPHEVDLFYLGQGDSMHRFKRAAITGLEINYSAEDSVAFFQGSGRPAFISLKLQFTETQIWTGEDFMDEPQAGGTSA